MGAAFSDNFLLSPYYYSVLTRERTPPGAGAGGGRGAGGAFAPGSVGTSAFPGVPAAPSYDPTDPDFDSELRIRKAMDLVKILALKKVDVRYLCHVYKRWENDVELEMDCFKDQGLIDFFEQDCNSSHWWVGGGGSSSWGSGGVVFTVQESSCSRQSPGEGGAADKIPPQPITKTKR